MTTNISFSDLELPRAAVLRILKKTVTSQSVSPLVELCGLVECRKTDGTEGRQAGHYKIGDPLHFILDRRVSAFVSNSRWLTKRYSAQQNTAKMGQRTISVGHVLAALETIGFPEFVQSLKARLEGERFPVFDGLSPNKPLCCLFYSLCG